jgi:hypothetical protein
MGKNKYVESPEKMAEYFETYKNETKSSPIKKHVFVGKDGNADYELIERPLTVDGFELWCWRNNIISDLSNYFANSNNKYAEYSTICSRIRKEVRNDQIEKGLAGIYNTSITQRLNGLTDKSEITVKEQPLFPDDQF